MRIAAKRGWGIRPMVALAGLVALTACTVPRPEAPLVRSDKDARIAATLYLSQSGPDQDDARFDFSRQDAHETRITLKATASRPLPAEITCDGAARLALAPAPDKGLYLRPGASRRFTLPSRLAETMPRLVLTPEVTRCTLNWGDNQVALVAEDLADPAVARLDARTDLCLVPPEAGLDPLARAFFANRVLSQTCASPTGRYALYPDEIDALRLRLERLTGGTVTRAMLTAGDPDMALDFSHAPHFDEIVVSYLHMRADLSGYLVTRALAFHAARGTKVRIAMANGLMLGLDRRLIEALASQYPNVQIQYFRWSSRRPIGLTGIFNTYQRAHHVKIFAALSPEPDQSFVLIGGRNMHDMFFFPELPDRPSRPFLHDYTNDSALQNPFAFFNPYEDFEIGLFDHATVAEVVAHFGKFWTRDDRGAVMAPMIAASRESAGAPRDGVVRHFISLPWADGQDQEAYYVALIDAARDEVLALSPFTYPTPAIDAALLRAEARGVRVRLITRFIGGEPPAMFVNGLNTDYFDRRASDFEMVTYTPENRLLHTKLIVIDRRLAIVASTNLNRRSFLHDGENGLVFLDRAVAGQVHALVERYWVNGKPMPDNRFFLNLGRILEATPEVAQIF